MTFDAEMEKHAATLKEHAAKYSGPLPDALRALLADWKQRGEGKQVYRLAAERAEARIKELEAALRDVIEDSQGEDAPINRGLNSIQAAERALAGGTDAD